MRFSDPELQIGTEAIFWALKNIKLGVEIDLPLVPLAVSNSTSSGIYGVRNLILTLSLFFVLFIIESHILS